MYSRAKYDRKKRTKLRFLDPVQRERVLIACSLFASWMIHRRQLEGVSKCRIVLERTTRDFEEHTLYLEATVLVHRCCTRGEETHEKDDIGGVELSITGRGSWGGHGDGR